nr:50S ribosomal protein L4 [Candidatus Cloacimonadota bacterium]
MLEVNKYSFDGEAIGKVNLPESLFAVESKNPKALLYEVLNMYLANQRQGTSAVQSRSEAHGSGRKLFRQKGTGNARPGNLRTPLRVGGGNAFGPKPKDWHKSIPKKKKRLALKL